MKNARNFQHATSYPKNYSYKRNWVVFVGIVLGFIVLGQAIGYAQSHKDNTQQTK